MRVRTAVIPVGGYASRMQPITRAVPKPMLSIVNKPVIHYIVEEAVASGMERVVIVAGFRSGVVRDYFEPEPEFDRRSHGDSDLFPGTDIEVIEQDRPRGLVEAVLCAGDLLQREPFAVMLGDDIIRSEVPAVEQLVSEFSGESIVGAMEVSPDRVRNYGVILPGGKGSFPVEGMVEKPDRDVGSNTVCCGRYVFGYDSLDLMREVYICEGTSANLTDVILEDMSRGGRPGCVVVRGRRYDTGNPDAFRETLRAALDEGWS